MIALTVRLLCSLAVVVGLMLLLARFAGRRFQARPGAAIQVMHRQSIGRGQSVAVISVGTRVLVIGTTEHQVSLLTEVEPDEIEMYGDPSAAVSSVEVRAERSSKPTRPAPLSGSVLSVSTWKQALAAATSGLEARSARTSTDDPRSARTSTDDRRSARTSTDDPRSARTSTDEERHAS